MKGYPARSSPSSTEGCWKTFIMISFTPANSKQHPQGMVTRVHVGRGNGFLQPSPGLEHLYVKPGSKSFQDLITLMDHGVIVAGAMGAHSGNI